jgi:N utilization substance protein B
LHIDLLEGWRIERLSKISLSAIRLSVYEIKYRSDIPGSVSISEAVRLAKNYEGDEGRELCKRCFGVPD